MATQLIHLCEYQSQHFRASELSPDEAAFIYTHYGNQIDVEFPSLKNSQHTILTSKGWVGYFPLSVDKGLLVAPKAPIASLFAMLDYSYMSLLDLELDDGVRQARMDCDSLPGFFNELAKLLAVRVLRRCRQGLYQAYSTQRATLPYVRGKILYNRLDRTLGSPNLPCAYQAVTPAVEENQILTWTLHCILRSGLCNSSALLPVQQAYRALLPLTGVVPIASAACTGRSYSPLNNDYQPLHSLCRFFLDAAGPSHTVGERAMLPFAFDMARLYEEAVAGWLQRHLPPPYHLARQVTHPLGHQTCFRIDLIISGPGPSCWVIDTKYKGAIHPESADIAQVLAYAVARRAHEAILLYPAPPVHPTAISVSGIQVRSLLFDLHQPLVDAGTQFLRDLFHSPGLEPAPVPTTSAISQTIHRL
jgi:5-methylcytosine-specific restriction enzyme subunit McrC